MNLRAGINLKKELKKLERYNRIPANNHNLTYHNFKTKDECAFNSIKNMDWCKNLFKSKNAEECLNPSAKKILCTTISIASAAVIIGFALGKYSVRKSKLNLLRELIS